MERECVERRFEHVDPAPFCDDVVRKMALEATVKRKAAPIGSRDQRAGRDAEILERLLEREKCQIEFRILLDLESGVVELMRGERNDRQLFAGRVDSGMAPPTADGFEGEDHALNVF